MTSLTERMPRYTSPRRLLHAGINYVGYIAASAVHRTAAASKNYADTHPRSVTGSGLALALGGLGLAIEQAGRMGTALADKVSANIVGYLTDQPTTVAEAPISSLPAIAGLGIATVGATVGATLTAFGLRRNQQIQDALMVGQGDETTVPDFEPRTVTHFSVGGVQREYSIREHEHTFSQPYRPSITERFDAWAEQKLSDLRAWYRDIRSRQQAQATLEQPYTPFPQTTNVIGEPLLPG